MSFNRFKKEWLKEREEMLQLKLEKLGD